MFGRKDASEPTENTTQDSNTAARTVAPDPQRTLGATAPAATPASSPRARMDLPHSSRRTSDRIGDGTERKLTVGRGLSLSGEISSCDILVVEGKVDAKLTDGKLLEIAESGQFRGNVEIESADIAGRYDGDLTVHGRLTVRGTGRISGMVKYGELEVNAGGQIIGEIQVVGTSSNAQQQQQPSGRGGFKNAAKFAAPTPEEEEDPLFARKASNS